MKWSLQDFAHGMVAMLLLVKEASDVYDIMKSTAKID